MNESGVWARVGKHRLNLSSCVSSTIGKCLSRGKAIVEGGKVRVIHSGLNTSFWWDNWTKLGPIRFLIQGPFKREECNIYVAEAANFQGGGRKDGNFDLKSAYTLALRAYRNIPISGLCSLCSIGFETPHHLFYSCNATRSVWSIVHLALARAAEFTFLTPNAIKKNAQIPISIKWEPPALGWFKLINIDGSCLGPNNYIGAAGIIRNDSGHWVNGVAQFCGPSFLNPPNASLGIFTGRKIVAPIILRNMWRL
ncbi:reverse transcriptase [Senna tora]|uniref:Reverse transcriptase n=1 Tax=Senna tora TaxID=362788 RepID=A0A834W6K5_9FABA|nr:reverse transcriptase [Senna tora]